METVKELNKLREKIRVEKDQIGYKGKYKYRSLENIYAALKKEGANITVNTELVELGGKLIIKATTTFIGEVGDVKTNGFCCVENTTMSKEQAFGSAQTYAIRYALQNLLLLEDNLDVDSKEFQEQAQTFKTLRETRPKLAQEYNVLETRVQDYCHKKFRKKEEDLTEKEYDYVKKIIEESLKNEF